MRASRIISVLLVTLISASAVVMFAGCNNKGDSSATSSTATTAASASSKATAATQSADSGQGSVQNSSDVQSSNTNEQQGTGDSNAIGITSEQAIANVKNQVGDDAEILSCV